MIQVPTMSFFEYCELLNLDRPKLPKTLKVTPLLHTGGEDNIGQIRLHEFFRFVQVVQMSIVKRVVFRDDTEDCHTSPSFTHRLIPG